MTKTAAYEGGVWHRLDFHVVASEPALAQATQRFKASEEGPAGTAGAAGATKWLREFAVDDRGSVTRVLLDDGEVIAFYTLSSGQAEIRDASKRDVLKLLGGPEIGSSHINWIARAENAPAGAATAAILHAGSVASELALQEGKGLLTLDPYDAATDRMWREWGLSQRIPPPQRTRVLSGSISRFRSRMSARVVASIGTHAGTVCTCLFPEGNDGWLLGRSNNSRTANDGLLDAAFDVFNGGHVNFLSERLLER